MQGPPDWLEIPALFGDHQNARIRGAFDAYGVKYWTDAVPTGLDQLGGTHAHVLYVHPDEDRLAATILRMVLELEDATADEPFTGECPACGAEAVEAWACPDCELSFRSRHDPDSPLIRFVREHGGFEEGRWDP